MKMKNFGRNIAVQPASVYRPASEREVLDILRANHGRRIRVKGRLHSWSQAIDADDVLLDLHRLNQIQINNTADEATVTLGAGCQLKHAIGRLDRAGLALPSQGLITEQTIAGAIATATHGSGKNSLSHYVCEIRLATYDSESGEPIIKTISGGPQLLAARCSLGCLGVVLSVTLPCRQQYYVEEHLQFHEQLTEVLEVEDEYPLQQFYLYPHRWNFMVARRREASPRRSALAVFYHWYWFLTVDVSLHLLLLLFTRVFHSRRLVHSLYRRLVSLAVIRNWKVVDSSPRMLTMEHELFRHIEVEVFVRRSRLAALLEFARALVDYCDGGSAQIDAQTWIQLRRLNLADRLQAMRGAYTHHYPITIRKVLADDALISAASADGNCEPWYAVSFISYHHPRRREPFSEFAAVLASAAAELFGARPHWGKVCPIDPSTAEQLYPGLAEFRRICEMFDPDHVFRNRWLDEVLFRRAHDPDHA